MTTIIIKNPEPLNHLKKQLESSTTTIPPWNSAHWSTGNHRIIHRWLTNRMIFSMIMLNDHELYHWISTRITRNSHRIQKKPAPNHWIRKNHRNCHPRGFSQREGMAFSGRSLAFRVETRREQNGSPLHLVGVTSWAVVKEGINLVKVVDKRLWNDPLMTRFWLIKGGWFTVMLIIALKQCLKWW